MKFTKIPADTFQHLGINAGVVAKAFTPATGTLNDADILGPTTGGNTVNVSYEYNDWGEDIDNCPKNTKQLKRVDDVTITASGTFVALTEELAEWLLSHCDKTTTDGVDKLTLRKDITIANDFHDMWIVGDYSEVNTGQNAGFLAVHLSDVLSTGGFQIQTTDKGKMQFAYEFTAHFSLDAQDTVPFEAYIRQGVA